MPKSPSRRKTVKATNDRPSIISIPSLDKQGAAAISTLNFKVPEAFHREFKLYAVQNGMSMVDLLQRSFRVFKEKKQS